MRFFYGVWLRLPRPNMPRPPVAARARSKMGFFVVEYPHYVGIKTTINRKRGGKLNRREGVKGPAFSLGLITAFMPAMRWSYTTQKKMARLLTFLCKILPTVVLSIRAA